MNTYNLTKHIPLKFSYLVLVGLLFILNMPSAIPADAPGAISNAPLHTSTTAKPNIMFIMDNSGSMGSALGASTRIQVAKDSAKALIDTKLFTWKGEDLEMLFRQDYEMGFLLMKRIAKIVKTRLQIRNVQFLDIYS